MRKKLTSERARELRKKAAPRGPNKVNKLTRDLVTNLIEGEFENIQAALKKVKSKSPARYLDAMISLFEFSLPKLSRTELTGKDGEKISINVYTKDDEVKDIIGGM